MHALRILRMVGPRLVRPSTVGLLSMNHTQQTWMPQKRLLNQDCGAGLKHAINARLVSPQPDFTLDQVKVFQDERIIQLSLKGGETINYSMDVLRSMCECATCTSTHSASHKSTRLTVSRVAVVSESQFSIEWLDDQYRPHAGLYNLDRMPLSTNA